MDNLLHQALSSYFAILKQTGETSKQLTDGLILLLFISNLLKQNTQNYYTAEELKIVETAILKLSKTMCIIPCNNQIMTAVRNM